MNATRMFGLTKDLIAIDSTSGSEAAICHFLLDYLTEMEMSVREFEVSPGRKNIFAVSDSANPRIIFNTHIDTVPGQFGPFEDEQRIYGRGACDTHGVLAAQLEAILAVCAEGVRDLGLLLVVGEETTHDGAIHAGKCADIREPEVLIVGEPTENRLMVSQKGRLKADVVALGVTGHSGYPERFDSAVEKLCLLLDRVWQAPWVAKESTQGTTVNVTFRASRGADNQVPAEAGARLMFRCDRPCEEVKDALVKLVREVEQKLPPRERGEPHFRLAWDPSQNDPVTNLQTLQGFATGSAAYNTDIAYLGWRKARTFLVGPGSILQAHRDLSDDDWSGAEWINKKDQIAGVEIYKRLVLALAPSAK